MMPFPSTHSFGKAFGTALWYGSCAPSLPPVLSQGHRGWKRANLPVGNLLSPFSLLPSRLQVAEGVVTRVGHLRFCLDSSVTLGNLLM